MARYRNYRRKRSKTTASQKLLKTVMNDHKKLMAMGKPEKKHTDMYVTQGTINTGVISLISGITQGTGDTQRVGIRCKYVHMSMKYELFNDNISIISHEYIRVMIVQDKMGTNAPTIAELFESFPMGGQFAPLSPLNRNYIDRFHVLYDKLHKFDDINNSAVAVVKSKKINIVSDYIGTGATTFKNQIYLVVVSSNGNLLGASQINFVSRLLFTDD